MLLRSLGICLLLLLTPLALKAQQPEKPKTLEELTQDVLTLQSQLKTATENLTHVTKQVTENTESTQQNKSEIERIAGVINQQLSEQQKLLDRIDNLTSVQQEQLTQQQQILDSIATKDDKGNDVLRLSANMEKSDAFREDMQKAVNDSLDRTGEVVVQNRMQSYQRIKVNQTDYGIPAGQSLTLKVPVGTVTAQLPGQRLTNWTITGPEYKQKIDIVPDTSATVTAYRPISSEPAVPVYTQPTVPLYTGTVDTYYVDPWTNLYLPPINWYTWPY